jgi:inward rectifier potassium channel
MRFPKFNNRLDSSFRDTSRLVKTVRPVGRTGKNDLPHPFRADIYHWLLVISWQKFLAILFFFYFGINIFFALVYLLTGDGIANAKEGSFRDAFFFSIQTLSTVGYGSMYPQNLAAQLVVTGEVFLGLICITILTGLMFARFSKPTARVLFSNVAVICPFDGVPTLMFRAANQRDNRILEAQVRVSLVRDEVTQEGHQLRRFYDLRLLRSQNPIFGLSWLVMHPIDENSPFHGKTPEKIKVEGTEIWVSLTGLDETFSQTIHARYAYLTDNIFWNQRFVDIFYQDSDGQWYIDLGRFHDVQPLG